MNLLYWFILIYGKQIASGLQLKKMTDPSNVPPWEMHSLKHKVKAAFAHRIRVFAVVLEAHWKVYWAGSKEDNEDLILPM